MKAKMIIIIFYTFLISCQSLPALPETQITQVGERKVENVVRKYEQAKLTLVFENGARGRIQQWEKVLQNLPPNINVFAYYRSGYGASSTSEKERNSMNIVSELRETLQQQGLKPPYLLIGHSLGGLYTQQFARQYPQEVKGIVLVDAIYPGVFKKPDEFPWYANLGKAAFLTKTVSKEIEYAYKSSQMIAQLASIDEKPIVRLFNQPKGKGNIALDFGVFNVDEESREKVRAMYPRAKIVIADSSHDMQSRSPELVLEAIHDVLHSDGAFN